MEQHVTDNTPLRILIFNPVIIITLCVYYFVMNNSENVFNNENNQFMILRVTSDIWTLNNGIVLK